MSDVDSDSTGRRTSLFHALRRTKVGWLGAAFLVAWAYAFSFTVAGILLPGRAWYESVNASLLLVMISAYYASLLVSLGTTVASFFVSRRFALAFSVLLLLLVALMLQGSGLFGVYD